MQFVAGLERDLERIFAAHRGPELIAKSVRDGKLSVLRWITDMIETNACKVGVELATPGDDALRLLLASCGMKGIWVVKARTALEIISHPLSIGVRPGGRYSPLALVYN